MCRTTLIAFAISLACAAAAKAPAEVTVSAAQTHNMSCSGGVCAPTATDATLNVSDLENMLASGNVTVTTTGSKVQADNIVVSAPFNWTSASTLGLDAHQSIMVGKTISVDGKAGLSLTTSDGGAGGMLIFGQKGQAAFRKLSSGLIINGVTYSLIGSVKALASAVTANPAGNFALANDYDATPDGTYADAPVLTTLTGTMQGLGNTISNLSIDRQKIKGSGAFIGLFAETGPAASIASVKLKNFNIRAHGSQGTGNPVGGLVGESEGSLFDDHVSGNLTVTRAGVGGLAGGEDAHGNQTVILCSADAQITTTDSISIAGGLLGGLDGTLELSYATGTITGDHGGGLVGLSQESEGVANSYSNATVSGPRGSVIGGLIEYNAAAIQTSYASGAVSGGRSSEVGGLIGDYAGTETQNNYWDITTSGTHQGTGGGNISGVTGLTAKQFKSGLPDGFDPTIWAEDKNINNGLPYLIANPPD